MIAERLLARFIGAFVLLNFLPAAAWADDLDRLLETGVVRVAVPQDLPPFGSIVEGAPRGYDVDVALLRAADLGARLELVAVTSPNRIAALFTQRADLVIANLGITPERAKAVSFSTPYAPFFSAKLSGDLDRLSRQWFGEPLRPLPVL